MIDDRLEEIKRKRNSRDWSNTSININWLIAEVERLRSKQYSEFEREEWFKKRLQYEQNLKEWNDNNVIAINEMAKHIESLQSQLAFAQSVADKEIAVRKKLESQLAEVMKERDAANTMILEGAKLNAAAKVVELEAENAELRNMGHTFTNRNKELENEIAALKERVEELETLDGCLSQLILLNQNPQSIEQRFMELAIELSGETE